LISDSVIGLDTCEISRKVADIMFIYNLINYNIDCPEFLFKVGFHTPVHLTRLTLLFLFVPKYKTNLAAGTFFSETLLLLANSVFNMLCILIFFKCLARSI